LHEVPGKEHRLAQRGGEANIPKYINKYKYFPVLKMSLPIINCPSCYPSGMCLTEIVDMKNNEV
jgi:hypothetical protein